MKRRAHSWAAVALLVVSSAACASRPAPVVREPAPARAPAPDAAPPVDAWASATWEERHDLMTWALLPNLGRTFQRIRGERDPSLACTTCHGEDAERVNYKMPNGLPPLDPEHMPSEASKEPHEARMAKVMREQVMPQAMAILDTVPYDPRTKKGSSCFSCHPSTREAR